MPRKILLVEDSETDAHVLRRGLKQAGLEIPINHLSNPREAVTYLSGEREYSDRQKFPLPDILLLDLKMPEMDGFELLTWARSQPCLTKLIIVVVTRTDDVELIQRCYRLGANSFLSKDANPEELSNFVRSLGGYFATL